MEAILSGVSETAFFVSGERLFSVHLDNPEEQVPRSPQDKAYFLRSGGRFLFLPEVVTVNAALERLRLLSDCYVPGFFQPPTPKHPTDIRGQFRNDSLN